jgi:signal transduction histidine kinase/HAMP domain-containing protein
MRSSLRLRLTIIFIGLAIGPLLLAGLILVQRSYTVEQEQALDLQGQVAQRVSTELEAFLQEVANDVSLLGREIRDLGEPDRAQLISLLLSAFSTGPYRDVYDQFTLLDEQGQEQLRLSRQQIIAADELEDRSGRAEFEQVKASRETYFSPIRFDERTGEPILSIAIPLSKLRSVQLSGVLVADVRFKSVGDLIAGMRVSEGQTIYVVDPAGRVVAHQEPSLPLQDLRLEVPEQGSRQTGLAGTDVVLGVDRIELGEQALTVVAEHPASEALVSAIDTTTTILLTIVATLVIAGVVGFLVVRQIVRPIQSLSTTAQAISDGDLSQQVAVTSRDEIGTLATAFNSMTVQLRNLIDTLEERVHERTRALETSTEISRQVIAIRDIDDLLQYVVSRIQSEFGFYHTHIYLIEAETGDLVMIEGSGEVGRQLKAKGHRLAAGQGIVGTVASTNEAFLSNNVDDLLNFVRNPLLPDTKSELAVPLRKGDEVLGVLDIQSEQINRFSQSDLSLMQSVANQTAIAVDNARLLAETQTALQKVEMLNLQLTGEAWEKFSGELPTVGYRYRGGISTPLMPDSNGWLRPMKQAALSKQLVKEVHPGNGQPPRSEVAVPLVLRGQVIGTLGIKRDEAADWSEDELTAVESVANQITLALENARLSEEQQKTIVQLKDVDRLKSEFLTSMSHELRTPLNSIIGFADVILQGIDGELPEMAVNDVKLIHNSGQHLLALINDILDLSKIEAGKMELVREPLAVSSAFSELLSASGSLVKNKPVEIIIEADETLPLIYVDRLRFNQIMLNLVSNAVKFTDEGSVTIRAEVQDQAPDKMFISVTDTGIGIPFDKIDAVFDRFRQADDSATTRKYGGTGLGLPICKQLVEMHGGELGLTSEEGKGSIFYFTVPLAEETVTVEN